MATGIRRASFFHLLREKKNRTQDMSQTQGEAECRLQVGRLQGLEAQVNITDA